MGMEQKREELLLIDGTGKYKDPYLDSVFMTPSARSALPSKRQDMNLMTK